MGFPVPRSVRFRMLRAWTAQTLVESSKFTDISRGIALEASPQTLAFCGMMRNVWFRVYVLNTVWVLGSGVVRTPPHKSFVNQNTEK